MNRNKNKNEKKKSYKRVKEEEERAWEIAEAKPSESLNINTVIGANFISVISLVSSSFSDFTLVTRITMPKTLVK